MNNLSCFYHDGVYKNYEKAIDIYNKVIEYSGLQYIGNYKYY